MEGLISPYNIDPISMGSESMGSESFMSRFYQDQGPEFSIVPGWRKREELQTMKEKSNPKQSSNDIYMDGYNLGYDHGYDKLPRDYRNTNKEAYDEGYKSGEEDINSLEKEDSELDQLLNMYQTPSDFYEKNEPDSIRRKEVMGNDGNLRKYIWNSVHGRWILDNNINKKAIRSYRKKSTIRHEAPEPEQLMRKVAKPVLQTPIQPSGVLNSEYCKDKYNKNIVVDLSKVKVSGEKINSDYSNIKSDLGNKITLEDIPCILEYDGIKLNVIEYISRGSFGSVLKYSNETPLPPGWQELQSRNRKGTYYRKRYGGLDQYGDDLGAVWKRPRKDGDKYYEVAIKTYNNQDDSEIPLILSLEDSPSINPGFCDTLNARILEFTNRRNREEYLSIMDLMDGTLGDLIKKGNLNMDDSIKITKEIAKSFDCLWPEYAYTDLKSANALFKCYKDTDSMGKIKIILGDIGSIGKRGEVGPATYPPPESKDDPGNTPCEEETMVWDIGVIFLELIGHDVMEWFGWSGYIMDVMRHRPVSLYYNIFKSELFKIISKYRLSEVPTKTGNMKILLENIFKPKNTRIKLKDVLLELQDY